MRRNDETPWSVVVFEVSDVRLQQRILADFRTAAMGGVVALGTQSGAAAHVVVECRTEGDRWLVEQVVAQIDPGARCVQEHGRPTGLGAVVAPADG